MLIDDLADQLFQAVLESDKTNDAAVFIGNNCHVEVIALHLAHQFCNRLVFRNHDSRPHQIIHGPCTATGTNSLHQVLGIDNAENILVAFFVLAHDWKSTNSVLERFVKRSVECFASVDADDVRAGTHDLAHNGVAKFDDGLDERSLFVFNDFVFGCCFNNAEKLLFANERAFF